MRNAMPCQDLTLPIGSPRTSIALTSQQRDSSKTMKTASVSKWLVSHAVIGFCVFCSLRNLKSSFNVDTLYNVHTDQTRTSSVATSNDPPLLQQLQQPKRIVTWDFDTGAVSGEKFLLPHTNPITSSNPAASSKVDKDGPNDCVPMEDWYTHQYPSCNMIHEAFSIASQLQIENWGSVSYVLRVIGYDVTMALSNSTERERARFLERIGEGSRLELDNIVLKGNLEIDDSSSALKSRHKDAIVQEYASSSPFVASIYGHCAATVISPLSHSGDLYSYIEGVRGGQGQELDALQKLKIAIHTASGLAALHGLKGEPNATYSTAFAHNDLDVSQYVNHGGIFQLNDFNLGMFVKKRRRDSDVKACFTWPRMKASLYRAPEDAAYLLALKGNSSKVPLELIENKLVPFDYSKADVFSLGTVFYMLLANKWMWNTKDVYANLAKLIRGDRPSIPDKYNITMGTNSSFVYAAGNTTSRDDATATQALVQAINMCWIHDPQQRSNSKHVADYLKKELRRILRIPAEKNMSLEDLRVRMPEIEGGPEDYDRLMMAWS